jgi:hypothetical protein
MSGAGSIAYRLAWSNTLQKEAQAWADQCKLQHGVPNGENLHVPSPLITEINLAGLRPKRISNLVLRSKQL